MIKGRVKANIKEGVYQGEGSKKGIRLGEDGECKCRLHKAEGAYTDE